MIIMTIKPIFTDIFATWRQRGPGENLTTGKQWIIYTSSLSLQLQLCFWPPHQCKSTVLAPLLLNAP